MAAQAILAFGGINQGDLALNSGNYDLSYQGNNLTITKALLNVIADGRPPWRGLRSVGRITPPALSAGIPPQRRITASGYSPYTRDPDLGKVVLYQLSYSRNGVP